VQTQLNLFFQKDPIVWAASTATERAASRMGQEKALSQETRIGALFLVGSILDDFNSSEFCSVIHDLCRGPELAPLSQVMPRMWSLVFEGLLMDCVENGPRILEARFIF
jgi:hypothetical protein